MLRRLGLARARLARHDEARGRLEALDMLERRLSHRIHVRVQTLGADVLIFVLGHHLRAVNVERGKGVERDEDLPRVGVDLVVAVEGEKGGGGVSDIH